MQDTHDGCGDDYVETSDVEELAMELELDFQQPQWLATIPRCDALDSPAPRKRLKLSHVSSSPPSSSCLTPHTTPSPVPVSPFASSSSRKDSPGSISTKVESDFTSKSVTEDHDAPYYVPTEDVKVELRCRVDQPETYSEEVSKVSDKQSIPHGIGGPFADEGSQDPLNLVAEEGGALSSPVLVHRSEPDFLALSQGFPGSSSPPIEFDSIVSPRMTSTSSSTRCFSDTPPRPHGVEDVEKHGSPISQLTGLFSALSTPRRSQQSQTCRSPTLQPPLNHIIFQRTSLSPLHLHHSNEQFDVGAALTPGVSPGPLNQVGDVQVVPVADQTIHNPDPFYWDEEEETAPRRYSLRTRQARQLNPYEFEKRQYKRLMRHMPEAIVKVVSPQKKQSGPMDREGDYVDREGSREARVREQVRRSRSRSRARSDVGPARDLGDPTASNWYNEVLRLSDDELPSLASELDKKSHKIDAKKRKDQVKRKSRFPLPVPPAKPPSPAEGDEEDRGRVIAKKVQRQKGYSSPTPDFAPQPSSPSPIPANNTSSQLSEHNNPPSDDFGGPVFNYDNMDDDGFNGPETWEPSQAQRPPSPPLQAAHDVITVTSDEESASPAGTDIESPSRSLSRSLLSKPRSTSPRNDEEERKQRKALKALGRMLPAFMIPKELGKAKTSTKAPKPRIESSDPGSDNSDSVLRPGRSKVMHRAGDPFKKAVEVKGDSESSESDIAANDGNNSDSSSVMSSDNGSDGGAVDDDEAIEVGFSNHDFSHQYREPGLFRKESSLIDRMLSRTVVGTRKRAPRDKKPAPPTKAKSAGQHARSESYALDIVVGASKAKGQAGQTPLPFRKAHRSAPPMSPQRPVNDTQLQLEPDPPILRPHDTATGQHHNIRPVPKKQSRKQRRDQLLRQQTFMVQSDGKVVTSGRRRNIVSINIDDEGFHEALAPFPKDSANARPMPRHRVTETTKTTLDRHNSAFGSDLASGHNDGDMRTAVSVRWTSHPSDSPPPTPYHQRDGWEGPRVQKRMSKLSHDLDVTLVPIGLSFGPKTYLGKQLLHDAINSLSTGSGISRPPPFSALDIEVDSGLGVEQFVQTFKSVIQRLHSWVELEDFDFDNNADSRRYEGLMWSIGRHTTWLASSTCGESRFLMLSAISEELGRLCDCIRGRLDNDAGSTSLIDGRALSVQWFVIEIMSRVRSISGKPDAGDEHRKWVDSVVLLIKCLISYGLKPATRPIQTGGEDLNNPNTALRAAEVWICLLHLIPKATAADTEVGPAHPFWTMVLRAVKEDSSRHRSDFEASEHVWRIIFSLCAISQFSVHGNSTPGPHLPACWDLVVYALEAIRLTAEPNVDQNLSRISLRKRDEYVRLVVARCYLLSTRWHWRLDEAFKTFHRVGEIFMSRKFGNLRGEDSDFPPFLRHSNLELLTEVRKTDSAFSIFLKLVVQAAKDNERASGTRSPAKLRKLLSLIVPRSGVLFNKASPPAGEELSMLYNRFSSVIVAIYLEPAAVKGHLLTARSYVKFSDADWKSKQACIRALMYTAVLFQHMGLPLTEPLEWLEEMADTLIREYRALEAPVNGSLPIQRTVQATEDKKRITVCIQLLLGCVRRILETPNMSCQAEKEPRYPDPCLLAGAWVTQVFATKELTNVVSTRMEILRLVQTFLDIRIKVMPAPLRPGAIQRIVRGNAEDESQESQNEFDQFDLDLDDPDLIAALEKDADAPRDENKVRDETVAKLMDAHITPAIYRLVIQHFYDPALTRPVQSLMEDYCYDADKWVDCWVGCVAVIVQNRLKDWRNYLWLGPQSWERISDPSLRRRIGLRFMYRVLSSDPSAYQTLRDEFLEVLLESLVTARVTIENDFLSLLLSLDGLTHPLLRALPVQPQEADQDFQISPTYFNDIRLEVVKQIFFNLNAELDEARSKTDASKYESQKWLQWVVRMLSTMREIHETSERGQRMYHDFCKGVIDLLSDFPFLHAHNRLASLVAWGTHLEDVTNNQQ